MIEKMTEWGLVKYFGSLINSDNLGERLNKLVSLYETNTFMNAAKRLFTWAIVIIIIATIIDLTFYWLRPEQKERLEHLKERIAEYRHRAIGEHPARGRQNKR